MNYKNDYPISYRSNKVHNKVSICRSPIELKYFKELDNEPRVISYIPEPFKIPYEFEGKMRNYIPDVLIHYVDAIDKLVEIKVMREVSEPINIAKFNAAREYAKNNGMIFKIIVREVSGLIIEGEYDDHISAKKSEDRWLYKRILPPLIIVLVLLIVLLFNGEIGAAIGLILFAVILFPTYVRLTS